MWLYFQAKQREEINTDLLNKNLEEERKNKLVLLDRIDKLEKEVNFFIVMFLFLQKSEPPVISRKLNFE